MGSVWDSTVEVLARRSATVARVTLLTIVVPVLLGTALSLLLGVGSGVPAAPRLIGLILRLIAVFGVLAITAVASDPSVSERRGYELARAAWLPAIGAVLLLVAALFVLMIPGIAMLVAAGFDVAAARAGVEQAELARGPLLGAAIYSVGYAVFALWSVARLAPLLAVLVNDGWGIGAIKRAFALTRGLALRIMAVEILLLIVAGVAGLAMKWVTGIVLWLLVGAERPMLVAVLSLVPRFILLVGTWLLAVVFAARLYAAARAGREASVAL